jgi:hypothetical protein
VTLPSKEELLERERRWLKPAGLIAILGALLFAGGVVLQQVGLPRADTDPERLEQFHEHATKLVAGQLLQALGFALFAAPLFALFQAASGRAERVRGTLLAIVLLGPLLYGISTAIFTFGLKDAGDEFVERAPGVEQQARQEAEEDQARQRDEEQPPEGQPGGGAERGQTTTAEEPAAEDTRTPDEAAEDARENLADDVAEDSSTVRVGQGLRVPAVLALVFGLVYVGLWSMRTGLLTRFWGSLGMALGVSLILLGFVGVMGVVLWFAAIGLMLIGRWPGAMPPAWAAGEAIPWLPPGEATPRSETGEGSGREVSEAPLPEQEPWPETQPDAAQADEEQPDETQGQRRRKRKRRR